MSQAGGTGHFIAQRVTSAALALLAPWFVISAALTMPDAGYGSAIEFLARPLNSVGLMLLLAAGLTHMWLGMREVIEDYIQRPFTRSVLLLLNTLVPLTLGAVSVLALLRLNIGA